jgi:hypothetical protein
VKHCFIWDALAVQTLDRKFETVRRWDTEPAELPEASKADCLLALNMRLAARLLPSGHNTFNG